MAKRNAPAQFKIDRLPEFLQDKALELTEAINGNINAQFKVRQEALTTSDYPAMFGQIISGIAEQQYTELDLVWPTVAKQEYVDGFSRERQLELRATTDTSNLPGEVGGYETQLNSLPAVPELSPYPEIGFVEGSVEMWTRKTGARVGFSWESFKSDRWSQIQRLPGDLAKLASMTDEMNIWSLLFGGEGFNTSTFTADTMLAGNPALSIESLQAAMAKAKAFPAVVAGKRTRANTIRKWALVVPTSLGLRARSILSVTEMEVVEAGTTYKRSVDFGGDIEVVEVPWIPNLATTVSGNYASTMWALVPYGGQGSEVTSIASVSMRGHESPELRIKNDAGNAIGGGTLDPYAGSFDNDDIQIRIRHINNGQVLDPQRLGFVASKGDES